MSFVLMTTVDAELEFDTAKGGLRGQIPVTIAQPRKAQRGDECGTQGSGLLPRTTELGREGKVGGRGKPGLYMETRWEINRTFRTPTMLHLLMMGRSIAWTWQGS